VAPTRPTAACRPPRRRWPPGGDLLRTHFRPGRPGAPLAASHWTAAVVARPVTVALLSEISGYSHRLAHWSVRLARDGPAGAAGRDALGAARQRLAEAAAALDQAQRRHPPAAAARRLLRAIPANALPPRLPPAGGEPVPQLCSGAANTAERLRYLTHPDISGDSAPLAVPAASWQRTAQAAAIVGHASELVLRSLALRARQLAAGPATVVALRAAATPLARAWLRARAAARHWDTLTTGTAGPPAPAAADAADLVLWMGRLAYRDPRWTPARRHTSALRDPAGLAADPDAIPAVLAAVHHASDAVTRLLAADREAIRAAAATRQLFTPTRLLPDGHDIPYRYAPPAR
jgi:hypothetical protein